jgi:hypothetical protein
MSMTPLLTKTVSYAPFSPNALRPLPTARVSSVERRSRSDGRHDDRADWDNARRSVEVPLLNQGMRLSNEYGIRINLRTMGGSPRSNYALLSR